MSVDLLNFIETVLNGLMSGVMYSLVALGFVLIFKASGVFNFAQGVFALFAAWYYWIGKISGFQYPEFLGQLHFWLTFLGVNLTFFPMHFLGMAGMPRRIPDYPDAYAQWNYIASYGSYITSFAIVLFFIVVYNLAILFFIWLY